MTKSRESEEARERLVQLVAYHLKGETWPEYFADRILDSIQAHLSEQPEDVEGLGAERLEWEWNDEYPVFCKWAFDMPDEPSDRPVFAWPSTEKAGTE